MTRNILSIPITMVISDQLLALKVNFLLSIDLVFSSIMWKFLFAPKVGYIDLKVIFNTFIE